MVKVLPLPVNSTRPNFYCKQKHIQARSHHSRTRLSVGKYGPVVALETIHNYITGDSCKGVWDGVDVVPRWDGVEWGGAGWGVWEASGAAH